MIGIYGITISPLLLNWTVKWIIHAHLSMHTYPCTHLVLNLQPFQTIITWFETDIYIMQYIGAR